MIDNVITLKDFLDDYGESMAAKVTQELSVIHDPLIKMDEEASELINSMIKRPFPSPRGKLSKPAISPLFRAIRRPISLQSAAQEKP